MSKINMNMLSHSTSILKPFALVLLLMVFYYNVFSQSLNSANQHVPAYHDYFMYGFNMGSFHPHWSDKTLADIAAGNPALGIEGIGANTIRPKIPHNMLDKYGEGILLDAFQHYSYLGMKNFTGYIGYPAPDEQDPTRYNGCSEQSKLFKDLYEPIWDGGKNGTPVNEENPYALYVYKTVTTYKNYVKFWEIMNEPDLDYTGSAYKKSGEPNNWWDNNPPPCDLHNVKAPIFHYIRTLRISYEVIKHVDPTAFVTVGGLGYPSFLDALLRNTDNPDGGKVTTNYPLKGGAYFDVLNFHHYPHHGLRVWSNEKKDFIYSRHSDAAAESLISKKQSFEEVLDAHGYNGSKYPEKRWILTESNVPRKKIGGDILAGDQVQVNFIIKALVTVQKNNIDQFHIYNLGDTKDYNEATDVYQLMGMYKNLHKAKPYSQEYNDLGIAYKTTADLLKDLKFDPVRTSQLKMSEDIDGGAFKDANGNFTYVLWAKTKVDNSENAGAEFSFPSTLGIGELNKMDWRYGTSKAKSKIGSTKIALSGTPIFLSDLQISSSENINLTAKALSHAEIQLTWYSDFSTATGFKIERSVGDNSNYSEIATVDKNAKTFTDKNLTEETKYYYRVRATKSAGHSNYSNEIFAHTKEGPVSSPSNLVATTVTDKHIKLNWKDNSVGEFSFTVERSEKNNGSFEKIAVVGANATSYNSYGLTPGTTYFYRVKATDARGDSEYSNEASAKTTGTNGGDPGEGNGNMDAPSNLLATGITNSHIKITWNDNSSKEYSFTIERSTDNSTNFSQIAVAGKNATTYNDYGLTQGTTYYYRVKAVNNREQSAYSNISSTTTTGQSGGSKEMGAPSNLSSSTLSSSHIKIRWDDNSTSEFSFEIERSEGSTGNFKKVAVAGANATLFNDYGLDAGTTYYYRVRAVNNREKSDYSNITSAVTSGSGSGRDEMGAPSSLVANAYFGTNIRLTWEDNSSKEFSFRIERSAWNASNFKEVGVAGANATSYIDYSVDNNTLYYYRVRAVNSNQQTPYSNQASLRITAINSAVANVGDFSTVNFQQTAMDGFEPGIKLYPNPASEKVNVQLADEFEGEISLRIMNNYQKEVFHEALEKSAFSQKFELDLSEIGPGLYFIEVIYNNKREVEKLIIN